MIVNYDVTFQLRLFYSSFRLPICFVTKLFVVYLDRLMKILLLILISKDSKPTLFLSYIAFRKLKLFALNTIN